MSCLQQNCSKFYVIISHPAKQGNIYERPLAAQKAGIPVTFLTGLYYKPDKFPYNLVKYLPEKQLIAVRSKLEIRRIEGLDPEAVISLYGPWLELALRPFKYYKTWYNIHDRLASKWIQNYRKPDAPIILHCFDTSSSRTILAARKKGIITALEVTYPPSTYSIVSNEYRRLGLPVEKKDSSPPPKLLIEMREADYLIAQSWFSIDSFIEYGVPKGKIILLPLGVDTTKFTPSPKKNSTTTFRVLFVGQLDIRKGLHHLLKAWTQLNLTDSELILAGLPINQHGKSLLEEYRGSYRWLGFVPHSQVPKVYQDSDIFVLPSLSEGGSNVIHEALACGLPSIVTTNAGSVVRDGVDGYVIKTGDVEALKEKICRLYHDADLRSQMSVRAREQSEKFSWPHFHRRLKLMYDHISSGTQSRESILDLTMQ